MQGSLTGLDNIYFLCRIYGADPLRVKDYVADFTELGKFLWEPVKSYSSGMRGRLGFALSMAFKHQRVLRPSLCAAARPLAGVRLHGQRLPVLRAVQLNMNTPYLAVLFVLLLNGCSSFKEWLPSSGPLREEVTGTGYSVMDVVKAFEKASGKAIAYQLSGRRPGDVAACYADPYLAQSWLGWKAQRNLLAMCQDHWNWQKNNPQGYA
jgi:hypothetical protein